MQAMLVDSIRPGDWIYEIKFDGYRAVALRSGNETRILSRNEKALGRKFPEVKDAVAALAVQDASLMAKLSLSTTKPIILSVTARIPHGSCETADHFLRLRSSPAQRQRPSRFTDRRAEGKAGSLTEKAARCNSVFDFIHEKDRRTFIPGPRIGTKSSGTPEYP
jgi:hypothetical protein